MSEAISPGYGVVSHRTFAQSRSDTVSDGHHCGDIHFRYFRTSLGFMVAHISSLALTPLSPCVVVVVSVRQGRAGRNDAIIFVVQLHSPGRGRLLLVQPLWFVFLKSSFVIREVSLRASSDNCSMPCGFPIRGKMWLKSDGCFPPVHSWLPIVQRPFHRRCKLSIFCPHSPRTFASVYRLIDSLLLGEDLVKLRVHVLTWFLARQQSQSRQRNRSSTRSQAPDRTPTCNRTQIR